MAGRALHIIKRSSLEHFTKSRQKGLRSTGGPALLNSGYSGASPGEGSNLLNRVASTPYVSTAPPPLHRLPYREELVATWDPSDADKPPEDRRLPKSFVSTGVCHPLSACRHGLVPSTATTACSEKGAAAAREAAAAATEAEAIAAVMEAAVVELDLDAKMVWVHHLGRFGSTQRAGLEPPSGHDLARLEPSSFWPPSWP